MVSAKLLLKDGRIRTLPKVPHIPNLAINLISISNMGDARVHIVFEKDTCKMIQGATRLMRGLRVGTLYKLLRSTFNNGCKHSSFLRISMKKTGPLLSQERRPCYSVRDWDILERRAFKHCMVKVWLKVCLIAHYISIYVNIMYKVNIIK
jgi:hypothetical protein